MNSIELQPGIPEYEVRLSNPLIAQVGNTPLFRLTNLVSHLPDSVEMYVKAEWFNPSGSVKDRPASAIIQNAVLEGSLSPGKTLLDATSGNMGIAYATFTSGLQIPAHLIIPANATPERLTILRSLNIELTLSDPMEGTEGARRAAAELAAAHPQRYFYADQYNNPANILAHYRTTGPEIHNQTGGRITHFVAGLGTSGTMMGTGTYLRGMNPDVQLLAVQPDSPFHGLEGLKHFQSSKVPGLYDPAVVDAVLPVRTEDAYEMARRLAREEGLLVGVSAAAAVAAALQTAQGLDHGVLVVLLPDSALKYLNEPFWENE